MIAQSSVDLLVCPFGGSGREARRPCCMNKGNLKCHRDLTVSMPTAVFQDRDETTQLSRA